MAEAEAPVAPAWALDEALKAFFPQSLEMAAELVLDEGMPAQQALARWEAESEGDLGRQDSTGRESRRLAALGCVFAAVEALDRDLPKVPVDASRSHRATYRQMRRALNEMHEVFDTAADWTISDEKVDQLMELTNMPDQTCRWQLRLSKGDVNRAAGRMLYLREQDADTHDAPAEPTAGGDPLPRQGSAGSAGGAESDTTDDAEAPPAAAAAAAEPADEDDHTDAPEQEIYGENHAFYANRRQIRSSHGVHRGTGRPPTLDCLRLEQQSSWGYAAQVLTFQGGIEEFHDAFGRKDAFSYSQLEGRHDYIQWLFPSPERSRFNAASAPLSAEEALAISQDPVCKARVQKSFLLICDFYGFAMPDPATGQLQRHEGFESRFLNLNTLGNHNFMRISRIVNCLNNTGWHQYSQPFLKMLYTEAFETQGLSCCRDSFAKFWMQLLPDWETVAEREFPEALVWLRQGPQRYGGGAGIGMGFGGRSGGARGGGDGGGRPAPAPAPRQPARIGVAFWNFTPDPVDVYRGRNRLASIRSGSKHAMYTQPGHEFNLALAGTGAGFNMTAFGTWRATDHTTQSVIAERLAGGEYSVGAVVCHETSPRFEDYRSTGIQRYADALQRKGIAVSLAEICWEGDIESFEGGSLPRDARASAAPPTQAAEAAGDGEQSPAPTSEWHSFS